VLHLGDKAEECRLRRRGSHDKQIFAPEYFIRLKISTPLTTFSRVPRLTTKKIAPVM